MTAGAVAGALVDAYNRHDLAAYAALHTATARITFANADDGLELDRWTQVLGRMFTAVPDLTITPLTALDDGRHAVLEIRQTGTHTGPLVLDDAGRDFLRSRADHVPPTGRRVDTTGVVVLEVTDGAIHTERHHWPAAWLYEQLGLATVLVRPTISPSHDLRTTTPDIDQPRRLT